MAFEIAGHSMDKRRAGYAVQLHMATVCVKEDKELLKHGHNLTTNKGIHC